MSRKLETPIVENKLIEKFDKGLMGKTLKKDSQLVMKYISEMSEDEKLSMKTSLDADGTITLSIDGKNLDVLPT